MQALFQLSYGPSDNRRTKRQQTASLASENLRGQRSALRQLDDAQIDQLAIEGYRPVDRPQLLQQRLDKSFGLLGRTARDFEEQVQVLGVGDDREGSQCTPHLIRVAGFDELHETILAARHVAMHQ